MEIVDIKHDHIEPDPDNPNRMTDSTLDALTAEIQDRGFVQPLLVRKVEPSSANPAVRYRIVDGEHRWRVLGQLGADTIPCVVDSENANPKLRMLTMNKLRGTFVPVKMAHLLADLRTSIPEEEIRERLALSRAEMREYLAAGGFEPETPQTTVENQDSGETDYEEPREKWVSVTVLASPTEAAAIKDLLAPYGEGDGDQSKQHGRVIAALATQFLD